MSVLAEARRRALPAVASPGLSPWLIAPIVGLAAFMEVLDVSIVNVSLQHVAGSLAATPDEATWVLTSYLVTNAIVLPISGWLSQTLGRKRYFLGCIIGFTITSLLCGLAPSLGLLIIARGLQGVTGGGLQPTSQAFLADAFPPEKRGQAFAAYGLAVILAPAIGPTVGGWITDNFAWRWVFLLNVPVGIVLSILATRLLAEKPDAAARRALARGRLNLDYIGFALLVIGMCALQVVVDKGQEDDWFASALITDLTVAAAVALTAFVVWEWRRADPIVDLRLLGDRSFAVGSLMMFMLGFALMGTTVLLPLFVQSILGYTATDAGLVLSPGGFATLLMMPLVGVLSGKMDARLMIAIGLAGTAAAMFHMSGFDAEIDYSTVAWARVYQSLGLGLMFIPINTAAFQAVPAARNANASAIINMMRNIGGSTGIALMTTFLARREQYHQNILVEHVTPYSAPTSQMLQRLQQVYLGGHASAADALHQAQAQLYAMVQTQATVLSYIDAFWVMGVVLLAMLPLLLLLRKPARGSVRPAAH
ncbi:MAG: DHA2 family efflux MFS transporter permease subunit [Alphaproteobacteria bacterium]|nr:DHA2 family efflux MFS transporter permease subunit [Alphaproteobacteria bacterium]